MDDFEVFDRYHSRSVKDLFVTIQRRGNFSLNRAAFQAMGGPQAVELLFNRAKRLIAFRPTDPGNAHAVPVRKQGQSESYLVAGLTFTKEYDIDTNVARRYSAKMQGNMLIVDLKDTSADATGPRSRGDGLLQTLEERHVEVHQQSHVKMTNPENNESVQNGSSVASAKVLTTDKDIGDALVNALMQLREDQKRAIVEHLLGEIGQSS